MTLLNRPTLRSKLNMRQFGDKGRTAVIEFTLPKDNTDAIIGEGGHSKTTSHLEKHVVKTVDDVDSSNVNVEKVGGSYKVQIRIENRTADEVTKIDEQMAEVFSIEDSRVHTI